MTVNFRRLFENFCGEKFKIAWLIFFISLVGIYVFNKAMWDFGETILPWRIYLWVVIILWAISIAVAFVSGFLLMCEEIFIIMYRYK